MRIFAQRLKATQQTTSAKSTEPRRAHFGQSREVNSISHLQRTIGNQAVQRLLQSHTEELQARSDTTTLACVCHDFSRIPVHANANSNLQPKLRLNAPADKYEQEADRVAEQVIHMPDTQINVTTGETNQHQITRACAECEQELQRQAADEENTPIMEEDEEELAQAKEIPGNRPTTPNGIQSQIENLRGGGHPLPPAVSNFFEPRFGHDFSQVRIHTDSKAAKTASNIRARAFTIGNDIVFGAKEYVPETIQGKKLLAHELTHVIQQGQGKPTSTQQELKQPKITSRSSHQPIVNRMNIVQVGTPPKLNCGAYRVDWKLELSNPAPYEGFMVQHVKVRETKKDCTKPPVSSIVIKPIAEFWESWRFNKGDKVDVDFSKFGYSDRFSEGPKPNSTGTHADTGKVKYFSKKTTGDLDKLWTPNKYSGGLPATSSKPSWWGNKSVDSGFHWASSWWNCCGDSKKWWNKTDAKP